ncbi:MAG: hypothetical protein QOG95_2526, partial [Mycobacterium sp.]|nr:hypothetical protein [Mycobacterium sp.]
TLPAVYIDLYQKDGSVRHLQVTSRSAAKTSATWVTSQPTGSLLVTAIGSERLLDIGTRPEVEPAARYLEVLQAELKRTTTRIQSDLVAVPPQAPLPLAAAQPYKCANTATNPESDGGFLSSVKQMLILVANSGADQAASRRAAKRDRRVLAGGIAFCQSAILTRLTAAAVMTCWRWVLANPI